MKNKLDDMIQAVPRSISSWGFEIFQGSRLLAVIDTRYLVEGGTLEYDGVTYRLDKNGFLSGDFVLRYGNSITATAQKIPFARSFRVDYAGRNYTLKSESIIKREFVVQSEGDVLGMISPDDPFTGKCIIDLPDDIPITLKLFMFWLVALMWRRAQNAAAC